MIHSTLKVGKATFFKVGKGGGWTERGVEGGEFKMKLIFDGGGDDDGDDGGDDGGDDDGDDDGDDGGDDDVLLANSRMLPI